MGDSLTHCSNTDAPYKQSLCSSIFFCSLPSKLICIISGGDMQFDFLLSWFVCLPKILHKFRYAFLVPNESAWQPLQRQQEIMVWISAWREIYLQINKLGSFFLFFFQFQLLWANESLPVILWFWKFLTCPYLGASDFGCPCIFQK